MQHSISPSVLKRFLSSRINNKQLNYIHPPYDLELQLLEAVRVGDENRALIMLQKINSLEGATLATNHLRSRKNALIAVCTLFTRAIIKGGVHPEMAFFLSDAYILEIEKLQNILLLDELEITMLHHFIDTLKIERTEHNYSQPVSYAVAYIFENIINELSLDIVAKHAYVHPAYLSSRFKQEVGITITDFINKKRVEESKYFLLHSETTISDIALLFKFCNQSYYTALFKKFTGMTPREYRKLKEE